MKKLIDISEHNNVVDLGKAKSHIDGVIARCSWGWGTNQIDKQWFNNANQANRLNIPLFAYHFCYARNKQEAIYEANLALEACKNYLVNIIYYDIEYSEFQGHLQPESYYEIAKAFCDKIEENGYAVGIYANEDFFRTKLINSGFSKWTLWIASYGINNGYDNWNGAIQYNPFGNVLLHQCTSNAKKGIFKGIEGIHSEGLDGNIDYGLLKIFGSWANKKSDNILFKEGDMVKVVKGAKWYDGKNIPDYVYNNIYCILEIIDDRVVIGIKGKVTGAINIENIQHN